MAEGAALVVEELNASYGPVHVLQDVSFTVAAEPIAVLGRNGMGKTTLVKALMGLLPARGRIRFRGRELAGLPPFRRAAAGLGYVPQGREIFPSLTVHEHLAMIKSSRGGAWTSERIYELFPRLADRRNLRATFLSGGEQQMLAIARALVTDPQLLVMDEPSEGLAPAIIDTLGETLQELARGGQQVLLVEQNMEFASRVADRMLLMVNGRVAQEVDAATLIQDPELQNRYLGVA